MNNQSVTKLISNVLDFIKMNDLESSIWRFQISSSVVE